MKIFTKITVAQNEDTLCYHRVRGQYFLAVIFAATIVCRLSSQQYNKRRTQTDSLNQEENKGRPW